MKKLAYALSVAVSLAALYQAGALYFAGTPSPRENALTPPAPKVQEVALQTEPKVTDPRSLVPAKEPFADLPLGQAKTVDFTMDEGTRARLTRREQADQLRDWLLFTVVGDAGLSAEDVNRALYDVPAVRHGYMRPVANFEYGSTRSCFIGNGRVIALLPVASQGAERKDLLAHVADDHRKNTGALPEKVLVFDYDLHLDALTATVTRRPEIDGASLFTAEYGYREVPLHGLDDLKGFLAENRDLVYVTRRAGELVVGGRQGQAHAYRGIRPEDVAAIWQAQQKLHTLWGDTEARFQREVDDFNARWRTKFENYNALHQFDPPDTFRPTNPFGQPTSPFGRGQGLSPAMRRALGMKDDPEPVMSELDRLKADQEKEWQELERRQHEEAKRLNLVRDVGFSLDPTYDYKELGSWYDGFADKLAAFARTPGAPITENEVRQARAAIDKQDEFPMLGLIAKLRQSSNATAQEVGDAMQDWQLRHRFQCARYDGDLQGTEVGMVLFYTDLVMKLWGFDYAHSTPGPHRDDPPAAEARADRIEDFNAKPQMLISPVYEEEMKRLPQTRQWLGPLDKGYQLTSARDGLLFAPDATRIFGKSSTGSDRQEVPANVMSDNFITWWNDHYEEVARYEPEYERLNEVMKWSLVISWLTDGKQMDRLGFLKDVPVDRSAWFPDWVKKHPELRYHAWDKLTFYPRGYKGTKTEAMDIVVSAPYEQFGKSWNLYGGVSLGSEEAIHTRTALPESLREMSPLSLRAGLEFKPEAEGGGKALTTTLGTKFTFEEPVGARAGVLTEAKPETLLRARHGDLTTHQFERFTAREGRGLTLDTKAGGTDLGSLHIEPRGNGFGVEFRSRDLDLGQSLARRLSDVNDPAAMLARDPQVAAFYETGEGEYLVKMRGADKWLHLAGEKSHAAKFGAGWQSHVADTAAGAKSFSLAWVEEPAAAESLSRGDYLRVELPAAADQRPRIAANARGPPEGGRSVEITSGNLRLTGTAKGDAIYLRTADLPEALRHSPETLGELFAGDRVGDLPARLASGEGEVRYTLRDPVGPGSDTLAYSLESGNTTAAARAIAQDPVAARAALNQHLTDGLH
ncbi:MAG TPA: hypothetical protein VJ739_05750, partial [Gemmataceae bacterium]|nr:hypothetical protein [Gemmataceae bacterium]